VAGVAPRLRHTIYQCTSAKKRHSARQLGYCSSSINHMKRTNRGQGNNDHPIFKLEGLNFGLIEKERGNPIQHLCLNKNLKRRNACRVRALRRLLHGEKGPCGLYQARCLPIAHRRPLARFQLDWFVPCLFSLPPQKPPMAADDELPFKVEQWDCDGNLVERVIARADNLIIGRRAFEAACRQYPGARLTLRQEIRVIKETGG
jgi:hypothetical protein